MTELPTPPDWWTREQAAAYLGRSTRTLARWAKASYGPKFTPIAGRPQYKPSDVIGWLTAQEVGGSERNGGPADGQD